MNRKDSSKNQQIIKAETQHFSIFLRGAKSVAGNILFQHFCQYSLLMCDVLWHFKFIQKCNVLRKLQIHGSHHLQWCEK